MWKTSFTAISISNQASKTTIYHCKTCSQLTRKVWNRNEMWRSLATRGSEWSLPLAWSWAEFTWPQPVRCKGRFWATTIPNEYSWMFSENKLLIAGIHLTCLLLMLMLQRPRIPSRLKPFEAACCLFAQQSCLHSAQQLPTTSWIRLLPGYVWYCTKRAIDRIQKFV